MIHYPAEWQEHKSTWFAFPHNLNEWKPERLKEIQNWFISLYDLVLNYEDIDLIFNSQKLLEENKQAIEKLKNKNYSLRSHVIPNNDIWIRDYGPFFVKNSTETEILDFGFNAWGGKFPPWDLDNNVPKLIADKFKLKRDSYDLILEGGSVEFNGAGTIMTTEQCLLNPNRNPSINKQEIESFLKDKFNVEQIVWLKQGLEGDHTDGHIDDFARFVSEDQVLLCKADKNDVNYERLKENKTILENYGFKITEIPLPLEMSMDGERLPNSYANFIFLNNAVLVPMFNCKQDSEAINIFKKLFADRKILSIDSRLLIEEGGGLHCASKQEPL